MNKWHNFAPVVKKLMTSVSKQCDTKSEYVVESTSMSVIKPFSLGNNTTICVKPPLKGGYILSKIILFEYAFSVRGERPGGRHMSSSRYYKLKL